MLAINKLDRTKGLDLILHTPGGDIAATESLVDYLYSMFGYDIRVIVPQISMSAGTMIAFASKEIMMGKHSNLGPIDPQMGGLACQAVLNEFEDAKRDIQANPHAAALWQVIISKYHPTLLGACKQAIEWSEKMVSLWLEQNMCKADTSRVAQIIQTFANHTVQKSHARHISNRHGAKSVLQFELMPKPPGEKNETTPWPNWPMILRTSTSHEEGCDRLWSITTKEFIGDADGNLTGLKIAEMGWVTAADSKLPKYQELPGTERVIPCELTLLAMGFLHPQHSGMLNELGVEYDERGNIKANGKYQTNVDKVFTAGDMRRGQSLVVWAISEGREAARNVDIFLMGHTSLEAKDHGMLDTVYA